MLFQSTVFHLSGKVNFPFRDLSNPELYELQNTRHFMLEHDNVSLGVWLVNLGLFIICNN
jgi:hypothetical protein